MKKFLCVFLKFIIFFMSWALLVAPLGIPFENIKSPELWRLSAEITPLIAIIIVTIIFTRFIAIVFYVLNRNRNTSLSGKFK